MMLSLSADIGVDLGTASVKAFVRGEGIVLQEPSGVAIRPMRDGVIDNFDLTTSAGALRILPSCRWGDGGERLAPG